MIGEALTTNNTLTALYLGVSYDFIAKIIENQHLTGQKLTGQ